MQIVKLEFGALCWKKKKKKGCDIFLERTAALYCGNISHFTMLNSTPQGVSAARKKKNLNKLRAAGSIGTEFSAKCGHSVWRINLVGQNTEHFFGGREREEFPLGARANDDFVPLS